LTNVRGFEILEGRLLDEEKSKPQAEEEAKWFVEKLNFVLENNFKRVSILKQLTF
jgi:asparaginyl-tRNA synthetase